MINKEPVLAAVRHLLAAGAGVVIGKGVLSESQSTELIGAVMVLINYAWFYFEKRGAKKAAAAAGTTAALVAATMLTVGCTTYSTHVFRVEQSATSVAYTAYVGWTNYLANFPVDPSVSNEVKQARLKFAATVGTVEALRTEYETNTATKPLLEATLTTLSDQSSNIVWLINYYKKSN